MVAGNSGAYFLLHEAFQEVREERRAVEERGKQRLMKVQKQRETLRALLMGELSRLSELRIVLLGGRWAGKSSTGNTILAREEFKTKSHTTECVKKQGAVAGRQVTVVDTPGWHRRYDTGATPEEVKQEIVRSVSLFPAEPHALLLVIDVGYLFTETDRRAVEEHLELLGDRSWRHTIVLFTWGDSLIDRSIEQHIESWMALQQLVDKCGNRYHVLDNRNRTDGTQVTKLLQKIDEMVAGNDLWHISLTKYLESEERNRGLQQRCEEKEREKEDMRKMCEEKERENEGMRKRCEEKERENEEMRKRCEEKERENEVMRKRCEEREKKKEENKKKCMERERENEEMKKKCIEKEREKEKMEEDFRGKMEETTTTFEEAAQRLRTEIKGLKDREEEQQRETEDLRRRNEGKEEEISQLKEELSKLQKEKEESTAPVRNIVEMDLYMSGERITGSTELMSQEEEDRQRDRDRQMQREEEELRAQHQAEQEETQVQWSFYTSMSSQGERTILSSWKKNEEFTSSSLFERNM
ncbi:hypothetical protein AGOR_G00250110 [Albula goreensis]|uniref:AIG1-type G domain-containing protein n=1 Tax=Albula goreensis TaxID=1534307 RepID=A0A8T3CGF9_9TELE|nr:hypothetical protein AGOR_G00250110 [Albula goreensis]